MSASLRRFTTAQAAKTLMGLVPHLSVDNLVRATAFAERLTNADQISHTASAIATYFFAIYGTSGVTSIGCQVKLATIWK